MRSGPLQAAGGWWRPGNRFGPVGRPRCVPTWRYRVTCPRPSRRQTTDKAAAQNSSFQACLHRALRPDVAPYMKVCTINGALYAFLIRPKICRRAMRHWLNRPVAAVGKRQR
jgi:hypothetical protein